MPELGIKPPTKAVWDVAGEPHQLVPYTRQSEMNKHHLAPFFEGMVRKMEQENTRPNPQHLCTFVPKVKAILKCHTNVHIVELHSPPFAPVLLPFASCNHSFWHFAAPLLHIMDLWAPDFPLPHLFPPYLLNSCIIPTITNQWFMSINKFILKREGTWINSQIYIQTSELLGISFLCHSL